MKVLQLSLVMAIALCVAGNAVAATNAIPYMNSFEEVAGPEAGGHPVGYTNGESIVNAPLGWYAPDSANGTIVSGTPDYSGALPIPTADHDQVLEFTDPVTNMVAGGLGSEVWIDCLLQPTLYDDAAPEGVTDAKMMLYFNSNGYPVVWGAYYLDGGGTTSNAWHTSTSAQITTGQWVRVTAEMNLVEEGFSLAEYFRIYIDNTEIDFPKGMQATGPGNTTTNGPWLRTVENTPGNNKINAVTLQGTGKMDDFQVVLSNPLNITTYTITSSVDNVSAATIKPPSSGTGGTVSVSENSDELFTISALGGYAVTNVYVSYSWFDGWVGAVTAYTMTNVTSDGFIKVYTEESAPALTSNGTPHSYYDGLSGLDTTGWDATDYQNEDDADNDSDGMLGYEENLTGTDASDGTSYFRVLDITYAGDSNKVSFFGTTAYGAPDYWSMYRSLDLPTSGWDLISTNDIPVSDGTNEWWDTDAPGTTPVFYQPSAHHE